METRILAASVVAAALLATLTTAAGAAQHQAPVPILMYHVIGYAAPNAAFPELYVDPRDFERQMKWLASLVVVCTTIGRRAARCPHGPL